MNDSPKKSKPSLQTLLSNKVVVTGRDLIEGKKIKERELELFRQAIEFEERNRIPRKS